MTVRLPDPESLGTFEAVLPEFGYRFHFDGGESRGRIWRREPGDLRTHILHLVLAGTSQWTRWLALRDLLRHCEAARRHYAQAKRVGLGLASDRQEYTALKTAVTEHLLAES